MKKTILLTVVFTILFSTISLAGGWTQNIAVEFDAVNLSVNGYPVSQSTILYNGSTYVPLRATAEMLGAQVGWDESTNTAIISTTSSPYYAGVKSLAFMYDIERYTNNLELFIDGLILALQEDLFSDEQYMAETVYPNWEELYNNASLWISYFEDNKDQIYSALTNIIETETLNSLYNKLQPAYDKMNYLYSVCLNYKNKSGFIPKYEDFVFEAHQFKYVNITELSYERIKIEEIIYSM